MGHEFYLDDDDDIDPFFTSHGYHNGPGCALCHDIWCHHCTPEIYTEQCPAAIAQAKLPLTILAVVSLFGIVGVILALGLMLRGVDE